MSRLRRWAGIPAPPPPPPGAKIDQSAAAVLFRNWKMLPPAAGITFKHNTDPSKKYIVESMSGGVILIDYDRDGWPDIYFTNAPTVDQALKGRRAPARSTTTTTTARSPMSPPSPA